MLITFSGLDGAGKSSLIAWLKGELERRHRAVTVLHMNRDVGLYAVLRAVRDALTGAPPDGPVRAVALDEVARRPGLLGQLERLRDAVVWSLWLRRLIYPIDLLVFLCYRLYVETVRKRILIMDRYFYDTLVDVAGPGGWGWLRWLHRITPTPDVPVLLEISPEAAYARKGEYSLPYLRARETAYHTVFRWVDAPLVLQASDPAASKLALTRLVLAEPAHDTESRHAAWLLRLLLDRRAAPAGRRDVDWDLLLDTARRNGVPPRPGLGGRIPGTTTYAVAGGPSPLDVQHGRLGVVGERRTFPQVLMQHRGRRLLDGTEVIEPPVEDQLILQGLQRVWGRLQILL